MGEYKKLDAFKEEDQRNAEQKRPYEKPRMTAVSLFADQVLINCLKSDGSCSNPGPVADS